MFDDYEVIDEERFKEALAFFLLMYAPDNWREILGMDDLDA